MNHYSLSKRKEICLLHDRGKGKTEVENSRVEQAENTKEKKDCLSVQLLQEESKLMCVAWS